MFFNLLGMAVMFAALATQTNFSAEAPELAEPQAYNTIEPGMADIYVFDFQSGVPSCLQVQSLGDVQLNVLVFDKNLDPMGSGTTTGGLDDIACFPEYTGLVLIVVENLGEGTGEYTLTTTGDLVDGPTTEPSPNAGGGPAPAPSA